MGVRLSVIVVSYNVKLLVSQLLRAIENSRGVGEFEVWVVDNASSDGTREYLEEHWGDREWFRPIWNRDNVGFGRANNQALKRARGERVLFLNPDVLLCEDTLGEVLDFMEREPGVGAVGVRMLHPTGRFAKESKRGVPTPRTAAVKLMGLGRLFPHAHWAGRYYAEHLGERERGEIEIVSGAFMMVGRSVLSEVGGFDEEFFMYGEDIDLSYRIGRAGYRNYYLPIPIVHYKGESTQRNSYRHAYVFYNAMLIFFNKYYRRRWGLLGPFIWCFTIVAAMMSQLREWWSHLVPRRRTRERYLFIGRREEMKQVEAICDGYGVDIECREGTELTLPEGHNSEGVNGESYDYVVYDMGVFRVGHVLELFERSGRASMGTYYSDEGVVILPRRQMLRQSSIEE